MDLNITNVITISVSAAQAGLGSYNTSNLALVTREAAGSGFGTAGYKLYLDPSDVATDFGSTSQTYAMALAIFSQQPNILAGGGALVIIPATAGVDQVQTLALSGVAASGNFQIASGAAQTSVLPFSATAADIQAAVRALPGLGAATVSGSIAGQSLVVTLVKVGGDPALLQIVNDTLETAGSAAVTITPSITTHGTNETLDAAINRTKDLVQYFGVMATEMLTGTELTAAATLVQTLQKLLFVVSRIAGDVAPSGALDVIRVALQDQCRCMYYGSPDDATALKHLAMYASRALSTNFSGSNTTQTMHLKDLIGGAPDPSMTQTLLSQCQSAGADVYCSLQGIAKVFTSGANTFFDRVYNRLWLVGALQVAGFNALAQSSTKLPQTEEGVSVLKGSYRQVAEQAISNQYLAPGTWTNPTTFGNQADFLRNIQERGYYIYSGPVSQQLASDRAARKAPLIQMAFKEAGAVHSSAVVIYVNP